MEEKKICYNIIIKLSMMESTKTTRELVRVGGHLKEVVKEFDRKGTLLHQSEHPAMVEFYLHDFVQVIVGSMLLAIPVGFTQEVWILGETIPWWKVIFVMVFSILFIGSFHYYNFYQHHFFSQKDEFVKRLLITYLVAFLVVGCLLFIIEQADWILEPAIALKRTVLVALPASLSAAVADMLK